METIAAEGTTETGRKMEDVGIAIETTITGKWDEGWTMDGISREGTSDNTTTMVLRVAMDTTTNRTIATTAIATNSCIPMEILRATAPTIQNVIELV